MNIEISTRPDTNQRPTAKRRDYHAWSKEELIREIWKLEKRKKYGLVWEDKPEEVAKLCKEKLPVLIEDKGKAVSSS